MDKIMLWLTTYLVSLYYYGFLSSKDYHIGIIFFLLLNVLSVFKLQKYSLLDYEENKQRSD